MITLDRAKTILNISSSDTQYDDRITLYIPLVEGDFRKISGYEFNWPICADYNQGESFFKLYIAPNTPLDSLKVGDYLIGDDITAGTYVLDNYKIPTTDTEYAYRVNVSAPFTGSSKEVIKNIDGCRNQSDDVTISQMIWFQINSNTTTGQSSPDLKSKTVGPLSYTFSDGEIDKQYGYPTRITSRITKYASMY